jgi:hypothetical protein
VEQEKFGSLATALAHANKLLATATAKAEAQAREILKVVPANLRPSGFSRSRFACKES